MAQRTKNLRDSNVRWFFVLPTLILLLSLNIFPLFFSIYVSFTNYKGTHTSVWVAEDDVLRPRTVGKDNYAEVLGDERFWHSFRVNAKFTVIAVTVQTLLGFGLALLLNRKFRGRGGLLTFMLIPMMLSPALVGLTWRFILDPQYGIFNKLLGLVSDASPEWMTSDATAFWCIVGVDTWMWTPFMMLISLAGLAAIPTYLYEAARVDRASNWFIFRRITLPMSFPIVFLGVIFRTMDAFKQFDLVNTMAGPLRESTRTVSVMLYLTAVRNSQVALGCALALVMLILVIGLMQLFLKYLSRIEGFA